MCSSDLPLFWAMVVCNFIIPFPILAIKKLRTIPGITFASACIVVGMWLERFLIIVPTLINPYLPYNYSHYRPTVTEACVAFGTFAFFILLYFLFAKFSPMISIWELQEGQQLANATPPPAHGDALKARVEHA